MSISNKNSILTFMLSLRGKLFMMMIVTVLKTSGVMANPIQDVNHDTMVLKVSVANIGDQKNNERLLVYFYESAREYAILKSNSKYAVILKLLKDSQKNKTVIEIHFTEMQDHSLLIHCVNKIKK